jgi:hypothetical protein
MQPGAAGAAVFPDVSEVEFFFAAFVHDRRQSSEYWRRQRLVEAEQPPRAPHAHRSAASPSCTASASRSINTCI